MKYASLKYSLKVWLTSVVIAPVLYSVLGAILYPSYRLGMQTVINFLTDYLGMVLFSLWFSFVTGLIFWLMVVLIVRFCYDENLKKWWIFLIGISLTIGTFTFALGPWTLVPDKFGLLLYANCACIGWGVWFYRLNTPRLLQNDRAEQLLTDTKL